MALALFGIALTAFFHNPSFQTFRIFFVSVGMTVFFDFLFAQVRTGRFFTPYSAIVSGLIIGLVSTPQAAWYQVAVIAALAMGTKHFLRISGRHIFNPAGAGIFLGGILFQRSVSWWGVSFQGVLEKLSAQHALFFLVLLSPVLVSAFRMRRHISVLSFAASYTLVFALSSALAEHAVTSGELLAIFIDPTLIFFSIVMLPDPMTSPISKKNQLLYGVFIASLVFLVSLRQISLLLSTNGLVFDPLLLSLLVGNMVFFTRR